MMKRVSEQKGASIILGSVFRLLDLLWPKDRNLIVFSGGRSLGYSDNSRYLFERFLEAYGEEFESLWVTPDESILRDVGISENARNHMKYLYSIDGIKSLLRAGTVFYSWGPSDLPGTGFSKRTLVIQLWHGIPVKRIGVCAKHLDEGEIRSAKRDYRRFTYWICSSMIERNSIALCTGMPIDNVKVTGYPRNDFLIERRDSMDPNMLMRFPFLERLVILYAPTYRSDKVVEFFPFDDFKMEALTELLERHNAHLLLRAHHVDDLLGKKGTVDYRLSNSERMTIVNRDTVRDVHDILPHVDILISDYSGIWVDFLLLNRPVVFVPYDLQSYERSDGLLYDYDYITPGPKVTRFYDMLRELEEYCSNPSKDSQKRTLVKGMFHQYEDGMAYKRIHQLVKDEFLRAE